MVMADWIAVIVISVIVVPTAVIFLLSRYQ